MLPPAFSTRQENSGVLMLREADPRRDVRAHDGVTIPARDDPCMTTQPPFDAAWRAWQVQWSA